MTKVSDKLRKVDDSFTVAMYDNGYMVDVAGRDYDDNYASSKLICDDIEGVAEYMREIAEMERA